MLALTLGLGACAAVEGPGAEAPHHRSGGFGNNHVEFASKDLTEFLRWRWNAVRQGLPRPPQQATPTVAPDLEFIARNARAGEAMVPSATWIGHASTLVQAGGLNILLDPIFSERASPVSIVGPKRAQPPGLALNQLPRVDLVLISHNHYDHLDEPSLLALQRQAGGPPQFVVPLRLKAWLESIGLTRVVELDWWRSHRVGSTEVVLTPVQHWSARGLTDRMATLWGGYAVITPRFSVYYAGDTGYSKDFAETRARLARKLPRGGFDLAVLPVGGYEPRWFMATQHINPAEAVQIHLDLGARRSMGVHWGTFELTDEPLDQPPRDLAAARQARGLADDAFFVLAIGETRRFDDPRP
ncbi:MBL fold metallo-hydrolase [Ideonella sp. A 288]|uniref:MBL fold metallo-hydrolase n=1 Tax=Ideonella sp. A 288 TaxID=1962181 RepID=UPI001F3ACFD1|nr:MBL fold metallo-hydrolase [Ideonella sp. A 288]